MLGSTMSGDALGVQNALYEDVYRGEVLPAATRGTPLFLIVPNEVEKEPMLNTFKADRSEIKKKKPIKCIKS